MEKRYFPSIGKEISLLGFGLMRLPIVNNVPGNIDYEVAESMVDRALEGGINYFDTAYVYHAGQSEPFAGKALSRHPRDSYNLATKMPNWQIQNLDQAKETFDNQLGFLQTDYLDFYLVHNLNSEGYKVFLKSGLYDFLRKKKDEGSIRHLGFSMHDNPQHLSLLLDRYEWDFTQIQLNYIDWQSMKAGELYRLLVDKNIPVIVMEPVRGGGLANLPAEAAKVLKDHDPLASQASWALRFVASNPGVLTVLSGMTTPAQLEDNLATFNSFKPLTPAEGEILNKAADNFRLAYPIPCTGCGYCMDCPSGVNIPVNLAAYNHYSKVNLENPDNPIVAVFAFTSVYGALQDGEKSNNCVACEECLSHCPQKIPIPSTLKKITELGASLK
ncbi:MAG: aldo/keto reductase [Deltaproteobacteria bacterium]|jgi:predicted aldo/keto reductase-like oxidoreductase|nr:aldo/keto reductase [Deltaproteobacteria bacterium]